MHKPRKRFGQHFLHDKQVIQHLVQIIHPQKGQCLVEIGPGQGALTLPVLKQAGELNVIELDRDLIPALQLRCQESGNLIVHAMDALEFDFSKLAHGQKIRVIGNLPYNISTPLLFHLLKYANHILDMHFMLQKEVVDRLAAQPNENHYGRLSIMIQYHCAVTGYFTIAPDAFYPPPKVESRVVRLVPHITLPCVAHDTLLFAKIVKEAFNHRRKTLRNCLKLFLESADWATLQIDAQRRPEELSVQEFVTISNFLGNKHGNLCNR